MAIVPNPTWALPDTEVDCLPGGFLYDDGTAEGGEFSIKAPTSANTKADIIAWLLANGVTLDEPALSNLTKSELIDLAQDLLD